MNNTKLDDVMGVIRTFVCNTDPIIRGREERYLPLTYKDAAILASEVANLRINLAVVSQELQRAVQQRDELHGLYMAITEKFRAVDPLWNEAPNRTIEQNIHAFIDTLMRSAGVLQDEPVGCAYCDDKWSYIEDLQEQIALHREQAREVTVQAKDALERVLPQAQGALVIVDIQNSLTAIKRYLENIP